MVEFLFVWNVALTAAAGWLFYENMAIPGLRRDINGLNRALNSLTDEFYDFTNPKPPVETVAAQETPAEVA